MLPLKDGRMRDKLFTRFCIILFMFAFAAVAEAGNRTSLLDFELSLAGYRLGMTFDEFAGTGRPFSYQQSVVRDPVAMHFYAALENVLVDDLPMDLFVCFKNDEVHKIIARIAPDDLPAVRAKFQDTLGTGTDETRVVTGADGADILQSILRWDFPKAELLLVGISSNEQFATLSLLAR